MNRRPLSPSLLPALLTAPLLVLSLALPLAAALWAAAALLPNSERYAAGGLGTGSVGTYVRFNSSTADTRLGELQDRYLAQVSAKPWFDQRRVCSSLSNARVQLRRLAEQESFTPDISESLPLFLSLAEELPGDSAVAEAIDFLSLFETSVSPNPDAFSLESQDRLALLPEELPAGHPLDAVIFLPSENLTPLPYARVEELRARVTDTALNAALLSMVLTLALAFCDTTGGILPLFQAACQWGRFLAPPRAIRGLLPRAGRLVKREIHPDWLSSSRRSVLLQV